MHFLVIIMLFISGCSTNDIEVPSLKVLSNAQQQAYLSKSAPVRHYGFSVFSQINGKIGVKGKARLHPNHIAKMPMFENDIPMILIGGRNQSYNHYALLDLASPTSWMEFSQSQNLRSHFLTFRDQNIPYGGRYDTGGINAFAAVVPQIRIDKLFIENIPLYVRMAMGPLGPQSRGIHHAELKTILGYDLLKEFSMIQFDFKNKNIHFASTHAFQPNESLLLGKSPILQKEEAGLVVQGSLFGSPIPVVLDLAGKFHLTLPNNDEKITRQFSMGNLVFRQIPTDRFDGLPRVGYELLKDLIITICPQEGFVYFEHSPNVETI